MTSASAAYPLVFMVHVTSQDKAVHTNSSYFLNLLTEKVTVCCLTKNNSMEGTVKLGSGFLFYAGNPGLIIIFKDCR